MRLATCLLLIFVSNVFAQDNTQKSKQQDKIMFEEGLVEGVDKGKDFSSVTASTKKQKRSNIYDKDIGFGKMIRPSLKDMRFEQ